MSPVIFGGITSLYLIKGSIFLQWVEKQSYYINRSIYFTSYKAEKEDLYIQHARNAGEKRVGNYLLDGYDEETNTAYEIKRLNRSASRDT